MAKTSIGLALAALLLSTAALAQTPTPGYPSRPITIVVPFPPGGLTDPLARAVGQGLSESLKQPVVVDNKAGATGIIAAELVRKAPPDGHMIFMPATGMLSLNPILFAKNPYETRDFAPVTLAVSTPHLLVVPASSPANSVAELVALARSRPSGLSLYFLQMSSTTGMNIATQGVLFRNVLSPMTGNKSRI